jgi:hypothetical protein
MVMAAARLGRIGAANAQSREATPADLPTIKPGAHPAFGAPHPAASAYAKQFSGPYAHRVVTGGIGHNLPQEAPRAFTEAVVDVNGY